MEKTKTNKEVKPNMEFVTVFERSNAMSIIMYANNIKNVIQFKYNLN